MGRKDPRVDAYIHQAPAFAKPILTTIRRAVHAGCPEVEETIKWGRPHFDYKGVLCGMSAFKQHCALGFWKGSLLDVGGDGDGMGQFGRLTSVDDLPDERTLTALVKRAAALNEEGVKLPRPAAGRPTAKTLKVPPYFADALKKNKKALAAFEAFSPSHRREYVDWIADAKQETTRERRIASAIEWLSEGKPRHWKYQRRGSE